MVPYVSVLTGFDCTIKSKSALINDGLFTTNKALGILDLTFATPQDSLWKLNSFFLVVPEQAFYCPNFLLDLQHLRMETLETSDVPSAHNAASEA